MVETVHGIALFVAGWIVFPGLFVLLHYFWHFTFPGLQLARKYGLSEKDRAAISNKCVSAFQATLATTTGFIVCYNCFENVLYCSHPLTLIYLWFAMPYFFYDTLSMFYVWKMSSAKNDKEPASSTTTSNLIAFARFCMKSPMIVIHHLIMAPIGFYLIVFCREGPRYGDFFVGIILLMEFSTPFVSFRFILSKLKMKSSVLYKINGFVMILIFPFCRIFSCFYAFGLYAQQLGLGYFEAFYDTPFYWKLIYCAAVAPQAYWYFLMWKGLIKMIQQPPSSPKKTDDDIEAVAVLIAEDDVTPTNETHQTPNSTNIDVQTKSRNKYRLADIFLQKYL